MKVVLCGYHWAGCHALEQLLSLASEIFVYTHDAPFHIPCLKALCQQRAIRYSTEIIDSSNLPFTPDLIISIYYRYLINPGVLQSCRHKAINLHPSLLPDYRGCSSLTWALINNESEVGFSYHYIDNGIDTGNILLQQAMPVFDWDTQGTLYYRVMFEALKLLPEVIRLVLSDAQGTPQPSGGRYYRRGCPYNGEIQADWSAAEVQRFIRAMTFPPYPPARYGGEDILTYSDFLALKHKEAL
ncbi:formyl transferase [Alishewanella sp. BS5-314]|uniref:formyltransferase family protein n=1 Tax=Alishewanella sp. BS5-314 TaxID=2755587 RepID=UPI0021BA6DB2|nr:formyltransferase family protein [Alishewanella sp. BS5-314]MCT8125528.1 formyl transferase [Alishewanella sp. BS5-314]